MILFALAIFSGAFLFFQVQPLIAKYILPWFGGGPAVWTTCMLFFQVQLLAGYAYAHVSTRRQGVRGQALLHGGLLALAVLLLPITPDASFKPMGVDAPQARILKLLAVCVGVQGLVLASTGPLLQNWFARVQPGASPYRLYALSNVGSVLALLSYPFVIEPNLSRLVQAKAWSFGFAGFAIVSALCAARAWRSASAHSRAPVLAGATLAPSAVLRVLWFLLAACGCALLLATTNQMCMDVSVIPFLWILPLSIYLLSFILVFHSARCYPRALLGALVPIAIVGVLVVLELGRRRELSIQAQLAGLAAALFVCCMVCHGELVRHKPDASHLTLFYLTIAAGGAFGGLCVALLAPLVFTWYFELHVSLFACALLCLASHALDSRSALHAFRPRWAWASLAGVALALACGLVYEAHNLTEGTLSMSRNFYGVLTVSERGTHADTHRYVLTHGETQHGYQFDDPRKRRWPTCYYGEGSGIGLAARFLPRPGARRIGVVGLGVGTIAAWGRSGDTIRFYELDPEVERLAESRFTYLKDSPAQVEVVLGDARISLEREAAQGFDILVLDAFSSDAIPVHLLTRQAFEIYLAHLHPDGVIAINVSNAYLDLRPVVFLAADHFGLGHALIEDVRAGDFEEDESKEARYDREHGLTTSTWVLLARNRSFLGSEEIRRATSQPEQAYPGLRLWTDDDASLYPILLD